MHTLFIWKNERGGHSETRQLVRSLEDLQDLIATEYRHRLIYLEARCPNDSSRLDLHLRSSADDLTDEDFRWLTASVRDEVRGVRV